MARVSTIITHCTVGKSVLKCSAMDGRAINTLPCPTTDIKVPTAIAPNAHHLKLGADSFVR
ncbi:MAG: hypothetical protein CM1200mP35_06000 [Chloroflexota bacterium]|nr:MAG: hypothetical protein CM1200mP35_06000 [Chloroflexota bacterium]